MLKKIIIPVIVIVGGIMLGVILSTTTTKRGTTTNSSPAPANEKIAASNNDKASLSANPTSIKAAGELTPLNESENEKIEKSILSVTYENTTSSVLTDITLRFVVKGTNRYGVGAVPNGNASPDEELQAKDKEGVVFVTQELNPGSELRSSVFLFGRDPEKITVTAQIKSGEQVIATTNPITVSVTK